MGLEGSFPATLVVEVAGVHLEEFDFSLLSNAHLKCYLFCFELIICILSLALPLADHPIGASNWDSMYLFLKFPLYSLLTLVQNQRNTECGQYAYWLQVYYNVLCSRGN